MTNVVEHRQQHVRCLAKQHGVTAKQAEAALAYCADEIDPFTDHLAHVVAASGEELIRDEAAFWAKIEAAAAARRRWAEKNGNGFGVEWGQMRFQDALDA